MRAACGIVVLLLLAAGGAAQEAPVDLVTLEIEPFPGEVQPLQRALDTTLRVRASCALAEGANGVPVSYTIVEAPSWASPHIAPATDLVATIACEGGWAEATATLSVNADDQAPAFAPEPIVVEVVAGSGAREQRARASVAVSASYFSIVDVQVSDPQAVIPPGGSHEFVVKLTNFGNGPTRVESRLAEVGEGLLVTAPAAVLLESKQTGGTQTSADVVFRVEAADPGGFVNRVGIINARFVSTYATDDSYRGDESTVSFLVTVRTGGESTPGLQDRVPSGVVGALAALCLGGLLMRRPFRP